MRNLPRYKKCFICGKENPTGLNLTFKTDNKKVYAKVKLNTNYIGYQDRIHGGIAASILDEAMGWACSVITKKLFFTAELKVKYKKPIPPNIELSVEAEYTTTKHNIHFAKGTLKDKNGTVLVIGEGKYVSISQKEEEEILKLMHHEPENGNPVTIDDI
ncbi:PaaI family thioesterase [Hippea maritima]|uniref:Acyl-coenzyme A thioesterase THEM4 n=1 Tax=Hippea maritima (strain ATCC 700847 / DSM 10411 / MH2) TaxID=760142 RepID=F2LXK3_HIPMA|nr:PaaI family thioesterase [Hippea maritima]AEA33189.1 thioesterase superfamily protein [Hippea maritima DSM 10411]